MRHIHAVMSYFKLFNVFFIKSDQYCDFSTSSQITRALLSPQKYFFICKVFIVW
eukprot:TRINITY_DN3606_c0_g1_i1.p1 TRINITY_DN3606_c0_g1~~TRINITY_DN3606_c0_g1_i1.p1  ORF type:complete len:54 (-),score=1.87 TRINITY_DN3606_c0_g1_i1:634-795(-)